MINIKKTNVAWVALSLVVLVTIILLHSVPIPGDSLFISAVQNAGHWILFFCLTLGGCLLAMHFGFTWRVVVVILPAVMVTLGVVNELMQIPLQRDADWFDIARNVQGVVSGIAAFFVAWLINRRRFPQAAACTLIVLGLASFNLRESVMQAVASLTSPDLPVVANFDNPQAELRVRAIRSARIALIHSEHPYSIAPSRVLRIVLSEHRYSGVELLEVHRNWENYVKLVMHIVNTGSKEVNLAIRISDQRDDISVADGYRQGLLLKPGINVVSVDLKNAMNLPLRTMDLSDIRRLSVYSPLAQHFTDALLLDDVLLQ